MLCKECKFTKYLFLFKFHFLFTINDYSYLTFYYNIQLYFFEFVLRSIYLFFYNLTWQIIILFHLWNDFFFTFWSIWINNFKIFHISIFYIKINFFFQSTWNSVFCKNRIDCLSCLLNLITMSIVIFYMTN